jgi:hypothetical protein
MLMTSLRLDYQRCMQPFPLAGTVLLSFAVAITVLTGGYYFSLSADSKALEDSLKKFEQTADAPTRSSHPEKSGDIKQASEVLRQLTLPWEDLFQAVESSTIPQVTLLGMEPDLEKHVVNISCEARDIASMLSFMKRLETRREFIAVYLQNHQIQQRDPERPVRFSLIAFWRAAA